ncbi:uncharacterized protein L201_003636 [Kwoniella dendrophila CBS 6074]|uniref:SAP domain-containing protein n=1 Tax=Kwoniella dendrophila CBS 6074 TaxID=1295534 RepID=A0AAX4JW23_9TREE
MLRRKISTGLLRSSVPTPQVASPICPVSPSKQRSRSLASAVLLSSQRNWKNETVITLKTELKKRGLSQQGNKATLVSRLESAETSSLLGPLPPLTFNNGNSTRSISTSASSSFASSSSTSAGSASKPKKDSAPPTSKEPPSITTTGPQVSSQRTEAIKVDPIQPEQITVAPGLPKSDIAASTTKESLDVKFPRSQAEEEVEQVIPITPDNFSSGVTKDSAPSLSAPKVMTVASASTHLEGGPVHATHQSTDAHSLENKSSSENEPSSSKDIPSLGEALSSIINAPGKAWSGAGIKVLPEINLPKSPEGKEKEYKSEKRSLNDDERKGLYVLAGILGLGLTLGGSGGSSSKNKKSLTNQAKDLKDKVGNAIPGSSSYTVKGDANWEKASGAGIVGHGSRKD